MSDAGMAEPLRRGPRLAAPPSTDASLPLERYGLIGDAGTAALVSDCGSIDWLCLPRFDSDPIFGRLLDPDAGHFSVTPSVPFTATRRNVRGTAVLATTFTTAAGRATVYDFFVAREPRAKRDGLWPFRSLIRRIEGEQGVVPFRVEVAPRDSFGGHRFRLTARRGSLSGALAGEAIHVRGPDRWTVRAGIGSAVIQVQANDRRHLWLSFAGRDVGVLPMGADAAEEAFHETVRYWHAWTARARVDGPHADLIKRSALTLKLLTFAPSGGIVAAPTTSLPESLESPRNWDYRYVWIRDAAWAVDALSSLGYHEESDAYLSWAINAARISRPLVHSLYTLHGNHDLRERELSGLRGYRGVGPVRKGNAAAAQRQLDNWGHLVDAAHAQALRRGTIDDETWDGISSLVGFVADHWQERDHGMWEVRSRPRHFVHSKVMAWVALDRGIRMARALGLRAPIARWEAERDAVSGSVLTHGVDATGSFVRAFGSAEADASLLLIPSTGFLQPTDPRIHRTIDRVMKELGRGDLLYRYLGEDGLAGSEGAFVACSFWLAQALAAAGRLNEARSAFDAAGNRANGLGLLPEEIDVATGAFLGNYPQALSHIALVNAAIEIERATGTTVGTARA